MKARWIYTLLGVSLVALSLLAAVFLRPPASHPETASFLLRRTGINLVQRFTSYESVAEVSAQLLAGHVEATRRTLQRKPDSRYPPHALDTLTIEHYALLNTQGRLSLQFFNDRLFEIDFKPDDAGASAAALKQADPLLQRDKDGHVERVAGDWRIAANVDLAASPVGRSLATEPFVLWQDTRLINERDDWDERFGAIH